jgi:YidC/Oxa1 family membrane protein insertase
LFHVLFYEPIFNVLMLINWTVDHIIPGISFAIPIIILTLLMRVCLIPLVRKQLRSQKVMQELQPRLAELKRQYAGDQAGMLQAQQALFKEHGYSPISGCLPLLIQMPFLYALYYSLFEVLNKNPATETVAHHIQRINNDIYPFLPHVTVLPPTHFLWMNLSAPDPLHILPLLAGLLTFVQLRMAIPHRKKPAPGTPTDATSQATKMTQYLMPVMTFIFGLNFPAGLPLYWSVSTGFSAVQQYFIGGWGSLFVGIPGMERFVPEPKDALPPPASRARPGTAAAIRASTAGAAPPPAQADSGGGGFFKRLRDQMSAAQQVAVAQQQAREQGAGGKNAKNGTGAGGRGAVIVDSTATVSGNGNGATQPKAAPRPKRSSARDSGPMLVKPSQSSATSAKKELPEQAIARDAVDATPDVGSERPEKEVVRAASGAGSASTAKGSSAGRVSSSQNTRPAAQPARKGQNQGQAKGSASARNRSGRPKGGK